MFSSQLRQRSFWQNLGASEQRSKPQTQSDQFDIRFEPAHGNRTALILLLEAVALGPQFARLDKWLDTTTEANRIVLLLGSVDGKQNMQALQDLQLHILRWRINVPVLLVPTVDQFMPMLEMYNDESNASVHLGEHNVDAANATSTMSWAVSSAPRRLLSATEVILVQQICGSIEGLERATRTPEGQRRLQECLGLRVGKAVLEFWEDEWIA